MQQAMLSWSACHGRLGLFLSMYEDFHYKDKVSRPPHLYKILTQQSFNIISISKWYMGYQRPLYWPCMTSRFLYSLVANFIDILRGQCSKWWYYASSWQNIDCNSTILKSYLNTIGNTTEFFVEADCFEMGLLYTKNSKCWYRPLRVLVSKCNVYVFMYVCLGAARWLDRVDLRILHSITWSIALVSSKNGTSNNMVTNTINEVTFSRMISYMDFRYSDSSLRKPYKVEWALFIGTRITHSIYFDTVFDYFTKKSYVMGWGIDGSARQVIHRKLLTLNVTMESTRIS